MEDLKKDSKAKDLYIKYRNGWIDLPTLHKKLFDLYDENLKVAYEKLVELDGKRIR